MESSQLSCNINITNIVFLGSPIAYSINGEPIKFSVQNISIEKQDDAYMFSISLRDEDFIYGEIVITGFFSQFVCDKLKEKNVTLILHGGMHEDYDFSFQNFLTSVVKVYFGVKDTLYRAYGERKSHSVGF